MRQHRTDFLDDFDGPAGAPPSAAWTFETGGGGWGDDQLQTYARGNAVLDGDGCLAITARADLTSARLNSTVDVRYGRVEARIKVPHGPGVWPAFWMLGADIDEVGWPACGEIDVMEVVGSEPRTVHATVHCPGHAGVGKGLGAPHTIDRDLADDFHVYGVDWTPEAIDWRLDDVVYRTLERADVPTWAFDGDMFLLLNLAIGGRWPGNDLDAAALPATMLVDWVRATPLTRR